MMAACDSSSVMAVIPDVATDLSITPSVGTGAPNEQLALEVGDTITLAATALNPLGLAVPSPHVDWSSADTSIARVDASGLVRAVGVGATEIRATARGATSSLHAMVNDSATS
jgi:uncharacterized protein YjdB